MAPAFAAKCTLLAHLLLAATATVPTDDGCNCAAACAMIVSQQQQEIEWLRAEVRALRRASSPPFAAADTAPSTVPPAASATAVAPPLRRTETSEEHACGSRWNIYTDADVEARRGCRTVETVIVRGSVTSLAGLGSLETAENVRIRSTSRLKSLAGLENLTSVEKNLEIWTNARLASLDGLQNVRTVGEMEIYSNDVLRSLVGLESLEIAENVSISYNHHLESLDGLGTLGQAQKLKIEGNGKLSSLWGFQNLRTVGELSVEANARLETLLGLEGLTSVDVLQIKDNSQLRSLAGLENLNAVNVSCSIRSNNYLSSLIALRGLRIAKVINIYGYQGGLRSFTGLEGLTSIDALRIDSTLISSFAGLEHLTHVRGPLSIHRQRFDFSFSGLQSLRTAGVLLISETLQLRNLTGLESLKSLGGLHISDNNRLASLTGLENLASVSGELTIVNNRALTSLSGLQGLRAAGEFRIVSNRRLRSLTALENLESVLYDLSIENHAFLGSLHGLESLAHVGALSLAMLPKLQSLAGLRNLADAWKGVSITACGLHSLEGLGALRRTIELLVEGVQLQYLGGPFAVGASVEVVRISEGSWPPCITPHERAALISAVDNVHASLLPEVTAWPQWQRQGCRRKAFGTFVCTRGQPCNFSLAGNQADLTSSFVSGRTTGCGLCSEEDPQANVTETGVVDLGYALDNEEGGLRSICRCAGGAGPVAQLLLRGPRQSGTTVCSRGHNCTFTVDGEALERTDHLVLMSSCREGNPVFGFAASWVAEGVYLLHDPATWYAAMPTRYQVCWRAPCSSGADSPSCAAPEDRYFHVGEVELLGAYSRNHTRVLGESFAVPNIGWGVSDANWMRLMRACGEAHDEGVDILDARSSGMVFDFGSLTEHRVRAGSHRLCWCQERDGITCNASWQFMAESGDVQILCPAGQEFVSSGRCRQCPGGRQQLKSGLKPCSECPAGQFSPGGGESCEACPDGTFAELTGSSVCAACQAWAVTVAAGDGCSDDPATLALLLAFHLFVGALCGMLVRIIRRQWSVVDVSLEQESTIITTFGSHGLSNFGRTSFAVRLYGTGCPGLDSPQEPLRVRVKDAVRLELLTWEGRSINERLDTSMGTLMVTFPYDLYHQRTPRTAPAAFSVLVLFIVVFVLGVRVLRKGMVFQAILGAAVATLVCTALSAAVRLRPRTTPLARRLSAFKRKLAQQLHSSKWGCEKGPNRAIAIGKLHDLLEFFHDFIRDRTAYYLVGNIIVALTKARRLSYAELAGAGPVEWFVSHYWGTAFQHFCMALQKHAESVCGEQDWTKLRYWVCFCSNNQHRIEEEIGAGWVESSFYITLRSGFCQGTCMVLDDKALPLKRIWCIFELLQTVKLARSNKTFQGLLLCTSSGVLNAGHGSVEVAMALAEKVAEMDLETAQASKESDAQMIRKQVVQEMGSYAALNHFVRQEVRDMLVRAQRSANQQFAVVLAHLERDIAEDHLPDNHVENHLAENHLAL